jgi:hypothetical protein
MSVSNPVLAWVASLQALTGIQYSASLYFSVNLTAGWEINIPIQVRFSLASADPIVNVYPSSDGGATWDATALTSFSIPRLNSASRTNSVRLPTGQYLLQVQHAGPNSASVAVLTAMVVTAVNNV